MHIFFRFFPQFLFLALGAAIVLVSLFSANRVFSQGERVPFARQKLYFQENILPDHLLYPVFVAFDRARLEVATPEEKVMLSIQYAWERLKSTENLLVDGYQALSFSTATKAYKYYVEGLSEAQSLSLSKEKREFLVQDSIRFQHEAATLFSSFSDPQRQELVHLAADQEVLRQFFIDSL